MKSREEPCARSHFPEKEIKLKLGWGGTRWEASAPVMYLGTFLSRKQKQPSSLLCNLNSAKFYLPGTEASVSCVLLGRPEKKQRPAWHLCPDPILALTSPPSVTLPGTWSLHSSLPPPVCVVSSETHWKRRLHGPARPGKDEKEVTEIRAWLAGKAPGSAVVDTCPSGTRMATNPTTSRGQLWNPQIESAQLCCLRRESCLYFVEFCALNLPSSPWDFSFTGSLLAPNIRTKGASSPRWLGLPRLDFPTFHQPGYPT